VVIGVIHAGITFEALAAGGYYVGAVCLVSEGGFVSVVFLGGVRVVVVVLVLGVIIVVIVVGGVVAFVVVVVVVRYCF